jgi:protease II
MAEARESGAEASSVSTGSTKKSRSLDPEEKERRALVRWLENRELDTEGTLEELKDRRAAVEQAAEDEKERKRLLRESKTKAKPAAKSTPAKSTPAKTTTPVKTPVKTAAKSIAKAPSAPVKVSILTKAAAKKPVVVHEDEDEDEDEEEATSNSAAAAIVTKPLKFKKVKYQVTTDGYAWLEAADGGRGEYAGKFGDDGKLDAEVECPFA